MNTILMALLLVLVGFLIGYHTAQRETRRLRRWLIGIRDMATDERVSRDTVRQYAVVALGGEVLQTTEG